jgi:hypothetical protein
MKSSYMKKEIYKIRCGKAVFDKNNIDEDLVYSDEIRETLKENQWTIRNDIDLFRIEMLSGLKLGKSL